MRAVVQRVSGASVTVSGVLKGAVKRGLLVYLGVALEDTAADADWLAEKIPNLRIFEDQDEKMNVSLIDIVNQEKIEGNREVNEPPKDNIDDVTLSNSKVNEIQTGVLVISQFTLLGDARKGRRPSWAGAAPPEKARELYLYFMEKIREQGVICESGEFQARMNVTYTNEGPVTILLDSKTLTN